jgi:hypothetical protein
MLDPKSHEGSLGFQAIFSFLFSISLFDFLVLMMSRLRSQIRISKMFKNLFVIVSTELQNGKQALFVFVLKGQ